MLTLPKRGVGSGLIIRVACEQALRLGLKQKERKGGGMR